ncbi:2-methylpropanoate--CoA ligase CCL4-like [Lolium perenne]|uniref:2-methylpropanoate--CoA ligase CCL4-like n=1 Tax=Lolium perenne TaxID=4522 RepID=UPI003A99756F
MSGAVLNSINTRLDARTVSVLLRHSGSKLILVDPALLPVLHDALRLLPPGHPAPRIVLVEDPPREGVPSGASGGSAYERLLETGPEQSQDTTA